MKEYYKCINPSTFNFTYGKVYESLLIEEEDGDEYITILDDSGERRASFLSRFEKMSYDEVHVLLSLEVHNLSREVTELQDSIRKHMADITYRQLILGHIENHNKVTTGSQWRRNSNGEVYIVVRSSYSEYILVSTTRGIRYLDGTRNINDIFGNDKSHFTKL